MKKNIFIVRTSAQTWGKSENLFQAIKNAGGFSDLNRELEINLCVTDNPDKVSVSLFDGSVFYPDNATFIQLNEKPLKVADFITARTMSRFVCEDLDRMGKGVLAQKIDDLEFDFTN